MDKNFVSLVLFLAGLGALNWGLATYDDNWNLVDKISNEKAQKVIYYLIAVAGVFTLFYSWQVGTKKVAISESG